MTSHERHVQSADAETPPTETRKISESPFTVASAALASVLSVVALFDVEHVASLILALCAAFICLAWRLLHRRVRRPKVLTREATFWVVAIAITALAIGIGATWFGSNPGLVHKVVYDPFSDTGLAAPFTATNVVAGTCESRSNYVQRPDAHRCIAGNSVIDPCFVSEVVPFAVCPNDGNPFAQDVTEVTLPADSVRFFASPRSLPVSTAWAVELDTGDRCIADPNGSVDRVGHVVVFHCNYGRGNPTEKQTDDPVGIIAGMNWTSGAAQLIDGDGRISDATIILAYV